MSLLRLASWLAAAAAMVFAAACAQAPQGQPLTVTGSAAYAGRVALPARAVFEATVEDVARAGAASVTVGRIRVASPQLPLRFSITVDRAQLTPRGRYVVRARIEAEGRLLFVSDTAHGVLGTDGVRHADIALRRVAGAASAVTTRMSGRYSLLADAAVFTDCASGERMAVAEEGDNAALQRAYLAARPRPGAAVLATVDGRVELRPPAEGGGPARPVLVVERHVAVVDGPCGTPHGTAPRQGTHRRLVQLQGREVAVAERGREPQLVLHPDGGRLELFDAPDRPPARFEPVPRR